MSGEIRSVVRKRVVSMKIKLSTLEGLNEGDVLV